jgi:hypothetical protein
MHTTPRVGVDRQVRGHASVSTSYRPIRKAPRFSERWLSKTMPLWYNVCLNFLTKRPVKLQSIEQSFYELISLTEEAASMRIPLEPLLLIDMDGIGML